MLYMWPNGQGQLSSKIPNHKMAVDDFWKAVRVSACCLLLWSNNSRSSAAVSSAGVPPEVLRSCLLVRCCWRVRVARLPLAAGALLW